MLTKAEIDEYREIGAIVVPDVLGAAELFELRAATDTLVAGARGLTSHNDIYDLEDSHTPDEPRVRRIKAAHLHHPVFRAAGRAIRASSPCSRTSGGRISASTRRSST